MPTNEEGEFELVLGNKQLLSVFAIVAVLLGVFFSLGYVVGRNSTPVDAATRRPDSDYVRNDAPSAMGGRASKKDAEATVQPVPDGSAPVQEEAQRNDEAQPGVVPAGAKPEPEAAKTRAVEASALPEPDAGQTFLQVAAVARPEAEILTQVLRKKGFHATMAAGPNNLTRVLVGPAQDTAEIAALKLDLEQAGFKSFVKKY